MRRVSVRVLMGVRVGSSGEHGVSHRVLPSRTLHPGIGPPASSPTPLAPARRGSYLRGSKRALRPFFSTHPPYVVPLANRLRRGLTAALLLLALLPLTASAQDTARRVPGELIVRLDRR